MSESFTASRFTKDNFVWPTVIEVTDTSVVRRKRNWFSVNEMSIHIQRVASIRIDTGLMFADIAIESTGGTDAIESHGHSKDDAKRIKALIEKGQTIQLDR